MMRWLVKHNQGWCAAKKNQQWDESSFNIATLCNHFVILPMGCKRGVPDCPECREIILNEARKEEEG